MREMKDSGVAWIGDIPVGWEIRRIKNQSTLHGRIGWQGLKSDEYIDNGPYLITGIDFYDGHINWDNCAHITEERFQEDPLIHVNEGDLLITKDGTIGKVAIANNCPEKVTLNSGVMLIKIESGKHIERRYLFYILQSDVFWLWYESSQRGNSTIRHLYQQQFYNFQYPLPDEDEQCKIADYLDDKCSRIDVIIAKQEKIVQKLKEYKESVINEVITKGIHKNIPLKDSGNVWIGKVPIHWNILKLKAHTRMLTPMRDKPEHLDGEIPWIRIEDFEGKYIYKSKEGLGVSDETIEAMNLKIYPVNSILCTSSCDLGKCAVVSRELVSNQRFINIIPDECIYPDYLYYLMLSNSKRLNHLSTGTIQANLSRVSFEHLLVQFPPYEEQKEIAEYLDQRCDFVDKQILRRKQMIDKLIEFKKSLIFEMVTGKDSRYNCETQ